MISTAGAPGARGANGDAPWDAAGLSFEEYDASLRAPAQEAAEQAGNDVASAIAANQQAFVQEAAQLDEHVATKDAEIGAALVASENARAAAETAAARLQEKLDEINAPITGDRTDITMDDTHYRAAPNWRIGIDRPALCGVYCATPAGFVAAMRVAAARKDAFIVCGWDENVPGGQMACGLGFQDIALFMGYNPYGGLPRMVHRDAALLTGVSGLTLIRTNSPEYVEDLPEGQTPALIENAIWFGPTEDLRKRAEPRIYEQLFRNYAKTYGIPVYWETGGVDTVTKLGKRIASIKATNGQEFFADYWVECSDEGDLVARAEITCYSGRMQATLRSPNDGYVPASDTLKHQFKDSWGPIDPFIVPGDPSSGFIEGVEGYETQVAGAPDDRLGARGFRFIMTKNADRFVPIPPPDNYNEAWDELLIRTAVAIHAADDYATDRETGQRRYFESVYIAVARLYGSSRTGAAVYDVNSGAAVSTDWVGGSPKYITASYAERRQMKAEAIQRALNFFFTLQHNPRIPAPVRAEASLWGFDRLNFAFPKPGEPKYFPYCEYVRTGRVIVGDNPVDQTDITQADGSVPRDGRTIASGSYIADNHQVQRVVVPWPAGGFTVRNAGEIQIPTGGADQLYPIPYGALLPTASECENLLSITAPNAVPVFTYASRMLSSQMAMAEAAACAILMADRLGGIALQDVPYDLLKAEILASPYKIKPVLPA